MTSVVLPANSAPQLCEHGCEHGSCNKGVCICEHPWVGHSCSFSLEEDVPEQMELLQTSQFSPSLMDLAEEILRERALQRESRQSHLMELDASVRMERAVTSALSHADELEGHEFRDALPREGHVSMLHALTETRCGVQGCAHGACNASGLCECDDGWSGAGCDAAACKDNCMSRGMCLKGSCLCHPAYVGESCEMLRCTDDCNGRGYCLSGSCHCNDGFGGATCAEFLQTRTAQLRGVKNNRVVNSSAAGVCSGHGVDIGDGSCSCHKGWGGADCSLQQVCADPTCSGHGVCESGVCRCTVPFTGHNCASLMTSATAEVPKSTESRCPSGCSGHGTCLAGMCLCHTNFEGPACETMLQLPSQVNHSIRTFQKIPAVAVPVTASWIQSAPHVEQTISAPSRPSVMLVQEAVEDVKPLQAGDKPAPVSPGHHEKPQESTRRPGAVASFLSAVARGGKRAKDKHAPSSDGQSEKQAALPSLWSTDQLLHASESGNAVSSPPKTKKADLQHTGFSDTSVVAKPSDSVEALSGAIAGAEDPVVDFSLAKRAVPQRGLVSLFASATREASHHGAGMDAARPSEFETSDRFPSSPSLEIPVKVEKSARGSSHMSTGLARRLGDMPHRDAAQDSGKSSIFSLLGLS